MAAPDRTLTATARDFSFLTSAAGQRPLKHPDFETYDSGAKVGIVSSNLGTDGTPVFISGQGAVTSAASFYSWFHDDPDYNQTFNKNITLTNTGRTGVQGFSQPVFAPLDGLGFGNQGNTHNYHYTHQISTTFTCRGTETLNFRSDDDMWVFINGKLAIDLGGTKAFPPDH